MAAGNDIRVSTVYLPQVSPGTRLSTNPKGMDEQLGGLHANSSGKDSSPGRFMARLAEHYTLWALEKPSFLKALGKLIFHTVQLSENYLANETLNSD